MPRGGGGVDGYGDGDGEIFRGGCAATGVREGIQWMPGCRGGPPELRCREVVPECGTATGEISVAGCCG